MAKKTWTKPELKRMMAGGAEASNVNNNEPGSGGGTTLRS
jgi:hypothetical protein